MQGDRGLRTVNNVVLLVIQNFCPPVFPLSGQWNQAVKKHMPAELYARLAKDFEAGGAEWSLPDLQWEVNAGMGAGLSVLLLAGLAGSWRRVERKSSPGGSAQRALVLGAIAIAILVYLASMGLSALGRLTAPFYFFIVGFWLLLPCHAAVIRRWWWRALAVGSLLLALLVLVITPPRPLWPAETILNEVVKGGRASRAVALAAETYTVNRARPDALAPLRAAIPSGETRVGMITADDPETSLWRPFGTRKIYHVVSADTSADLLRHGVKYIVINPGTFKQNFDLPFEQWLTRMNAELVATIPLTIKASIGSRDWRIVALKSAAP